MSFTPIQFFVAGVPATAGSKRAFVNKVTGKAHLVDDCKSGPPWRIQVQEAARKAFWAQVDWNTSIPLLDEPIELRVTFHFLRPRNHYRTGKNADILRATAPPVWQARKPDLTKLLRALEDALTGVAWRDDALIVRQTARKVYGPRPGADVVILSPPESATVVDM